MFVDALGVGVDDVGSTGVFVISVESCLSSQLKMFIPSAWSWLKANLAKK